MAENQYEIYFADVLLRGEYPGYIKRFFKEKTSFSASRMRIKLS